MITALPIATSADPLLKKTYMPLRTAGYL